MDEEQKKMCLVFWIILIIINNEIGSLKLANSVCFLQSCLKQYGL